MLYLLLVFREMTKLCRGTADIKMRYFSKLRKSSFQLLCTSLCSDCYREKKLGWFFVLNISHIKN